jgi:hypothetical protein
MGLSLKKTFTKQSVPAVPCHHSLHVNRNTLNWEDRQLMDSHWIEEVFM